MVKKCVLRGLLAILMAIAPISMVGPLTASAADACYYSPSTTRCDGDNPSTSGCSADARTVQTRNIVDTYDNVVIGYVDLRYSPHCGTNWSRATSTIYSPYGGYRLYAAITRSSDGKFYYYDVHNVASPTSIFTAMVYAPRVCSTANGSITFNTDGAIYGATTDCL